MNIYVKQALKQKILFVKKLIVLFIVIIINFFKFQDNYANASDLSILFDEGEEVKYIKNETTGRERIFDKNGNILLISYNSRENVGIVTDKNDENNNKQVLIYKTIMGDKQKEDGVKYDEYVEYQDFRIVKKVIFYDLTGDEIGIEIEDYKDFYLFNNFLIINCWTDETIMDKEDYITYKKQMIYYDLNSKDKEPIKLFDDFGNCKFVNDYMFVNFSKGNSYNNINLIDKDLYIFDTNMNEYKVIKSAEQYDVGGTGKSHSLMHYNRELNINNKKYYEVYYERSIFGRRFYNLLNENFDYVFNDDVLFHTNSIKNDSERLDEYRNRLNDKSKIYNKYEKRNNIFEKVINIFTTNDGEEWYYILKDDNYIRIVDDKYNDVIEKVELQYLYNESLYGELKKDISGKMFYAINQGTIDYYSIQNGKLVKILSLPIDKGSRILSNDNTYSNTFIVSMDDGYFYPLTFKSYYEDDWEYFELLELDEVKIYNRNQNIEPFVVKANWIAKDYTFKFDKNKLDDNKSIFYIMQLNDKRLIRVLYENKENSRFELFDESGEKIVSADYLCRFVDSNKDLIIISSFKDKTNFYDLDFNKVGHFDRIYNNYYTIDANEPYGKLLCLCTELKDGSYDTGTILIDKKMNVIRDNIRDIVYVIRDEADFERNKAVTKRYKYLVLQDGASNVKYKNGDMKFKTSILDLNLNEVFSTYQIITREEEFFDDNKNMVMTLLIYDDGYILFDNKMNVIEKGSETENCFENIKDKYKDDYMYGTEKGMTFQKSEKIYPESMGFAVEGKYYVNLKRPDFFEKINIKDNIVLYKNQYKIKIDKDSEVDDYDNIKYYYRFTLVDTQTDNIIVKDYLNLTNFKDNYFEFANAFEYGFMDYNGKKLISFSIFDDTLYEDMQKQEIEYWYR